MHLSIKLNFNISKVAYCVSSLVLPQSHFVFRFFVLLFVYVIGGIIVNKFKLGVESMPEMCPNYQFWAGIPSLIKVNLKYGAQCHDGYDKTKTTLPRH